MGDRCFGVIVCKADNHKGTSTLRGYIAMLVVMTAYRGLGVGERDLLLYLSSCLTKAIAHKPMPQAGAVKG